MKFKIDENLPTEFRAMLEAAGHDAATAGDESLAGHDDSEIADVCRREGRTLVTLDLGFADIRAYPPDQYPGLIVLSVRKQDKPRLLAAFRRAIVLLRSEPIEHRLWILEDARIRVREGRS